MRTIVFCDDRWHPASIVRSGLEPLRQEGFEFDWVENVSDWSVEQMFEYPVVVLAKANNVSSTDQSPWMTEEIEQAFREYVSKGNGLLALHSGTADYENNAVLRGLLGGVFASHPEQCPVTVEVQAGHPLTAESSSFTVKDEHYFMELDDAQADVFLTTRSEHGSQPGGWTRLEGDGRVCVLTPGHNVEVWLHPSFQALLHNALQWCGKKKRSLMQNIAFITGADRGLGFALCAGLVERGWHVFAGQYMPEWPELAELVIQCSERLTLVPLDVSSDESVRTAAQRVGNLVNCVDLLVNNAGVFSDVTTGSIRESQDYAEYHRLYDVNALGPLRVVEAFLPLTDLSKMKRLCFVSSEAGSIGRSQHTSW